VSPRLLDPALEMVHRRANPLSCDIIEMAAPDVGLVLRRATDQFFSNPPRFSEAPGASSAADSAGALGLARSANQIASIYTDGGTIALPVDTASDLSDCTGSPMPASSQGSSAR
jgi:hypothetical protein